IVDDTRINLTVVSNLLKNTRIQIDTAVSGSEAVSKAKDIEYDIILMDQRMPEMDGIEALHKIRATENGKSSKVPVICLTADAVVGAKEKYLAEGFDDYLSKPVDGFTLEKMLMKYLPKEKVEPVQDAKTEDIGERAAENQNTQNDDLNALRAAGIEPNIGLQYVQNDAQFYRSILGDYVDGEAEKKKLIQTCYAEEDWHNYMIQVHSLKSSSKMIGAVELSEMAAKQEQASKEGDTDTIRTGCAPMIKKYKEVADAIRSVIKAEAPAKQNEEILEFWPEK
ncbi:MAG: response regulator, partial [Lachnospiraceae bacterium]|nr:response regulator [Lachnospiraceae bacterium]